MAVRCIKLKLILSRGGSGRDVAKHLWSTHAHVNRAVKTIEDILILCRGREYMKSEKEWVSQREIQRKALAYARKVQNKNGFSGKGSDEEVLSLLRQLYVRLVPSSELSDSGVPGKGAAQEVRNYDGPLMDAQSMGMLGVFDQLVDPEPKWVAMMRDGDDGWERLSKEWSTTETARTLIASQKGRPPRWVKNIRAGEPWQEAFAKDQLKKRKEAEGPSGLILKMKTQYGLLPLLEPPIRRLFNGKTGITPWDRLATRLSVGHLLSWESWNHTTAREYEKISERRDSQRDLLKTAGAAQKLVEAYEANRHQELKRVAMADDDRPYRIGLRSLRMWDRICSRWLAKPEQGAEDRLAILGEMQSASPRAFGDPHLLRWLAGDEQKILWAERDLVTEIARLRETERLLSRKQKAAIFTPADARLHPRWAQYEGPGGSNLKSYALDISSTGIQMKVPLLIDSEDGSVDESFETIRLAPSKQFASVRFTKKAKKCLARFASNHENMSATLGSGDILLDRHHLENRSLGRLADGDIGSVWLKVAMDVDTKLPSEWSKEGGWSDLSPAYNHFRSAANAKSKHEDRLKPGLRVLSVDLGVRFFAACSVFELVDAEPSSGMYFRAASETPLWAKHERSFLLKLPGEDASQDALTERRRVTQELRQLRSGLNTMRSLHRLAIVENPADRSAEVTAQKNFQAGQDSAVVAEEQFDDLLDSVDLSEKEWGSKVSQLASGIDERLSIDVAAWRRATRARPENGSEWRTKRGYTGGKSLWHVNYLTDVRRLLLGWSLRGRGSGNIRRLNRDAWGSYCGRLLKHINDLKRDRVKTGADLLIQAARGFVSGKTRGWQKKFKPCHVILFEDLSRYLSKRDRPRFENSQLMRWCHREVIAVAEMQAELYGIEVGDTSASYSSRFHGRTGAPGVRVRRLRTEDLSSEWMRKRIQAILEPTRSIDELSPGQFIPWTGGEEFATLGIDGKPVILNADLNAAQNLHRRFWGRFMECNRLPVSAITGNEDRWIVNSSSKRLLGGVATLIGARKAGVLVPAQDGDGYVLEAQKPARKSEATLKQDENWGGDPESASGSDCDELTLALSDIYQGKRIQSFFRDPSGLVLPSDRWYPAKVFWPRVETAVANKLAVDWVTPF